LIGCMDKNQIAAIFEEVAVLLALKEDSNPFEGRAYENAARAINALDGDIEQLVRTGKLKGTPGLGSTIIKRIEELVNTGHLAFYDELRASTPQIKLEMLRIPGVGPKKINVIYDKLHINSIAELEQACREDKIAHLPGFGKKTQDNIMQGLAFLAQADSLYTNRMMRNFYGVLRESDEVAPNVVLLKGNAQPKREDLRFRRLMNGTITHGLQFLGPARHDKPISYYGANSGIGVAFAALAPRGHLRAGLIGLGAGTVAAYGHAGDKDTFYEINPLVVQIAQRDFSFLRDSKARIAFELGDARLTLERQPPQQFDLLAVDAFSSDSIPVHLLTVEAFQLYFRHLRPDGILAVHISNRHLYLEPVVAAAAQKLGKDALLIASPDDPANEIFLARWVLLANRGIFRGFPNIQKAGKPLTTSIHVRLWTDSYSSLFAVLK